MMGRLQVICTTDQIKEAKRNVQKYMRKHKSDEDFIDNISDDFVMGFMISQRMVWDDYDNGTQRENDDFGKWIPCSERLPEEEEYILLSFANCTGLDIGRYENDGENDKFYPGDDEETYAHYGLIVNAWMPLPEPYKGE